MSLLNVENIRKTFGDKTVLDGASFSVHSGEKIGMIGINGTGKSTLLRMIAGEETPDSGTITRQNGQKLVWLPQNPAFPEKATVRSYALAEGEEKNWRVQSSLNRLGIQEYDAEIARLSGGQKRKVALAKALAEEFDLLLLDEPTNHLDEGMIRWLEEYLNALKGTVLMVTHDRYFLDRVTNRILEISHGKIYSYEANYSGFLERKAEREAMEVASERKRRSMLRMELEWAARGCRARSTKQRARLERLEALKKGTSPRQEETVALDAVNARMGKKTIELKEVSKRYGEKEIVDSFSYILTRNQRLGIVGPNGCGKSTLLKMIAGLTEPDKGSVETGETIRIGYLAQEEPEMDENQRVIDYVKEIAEYIMTKEGRISASQMLERFLFPPELQYSPIGKLSGGEKRRLYLLGVLSRETNVLLMDEPGNNLDIPTLTILEDFLNSYSGIVAAVSHDRYFLDNVAERILEMDGRGHIAQYEGGYTDYQEAKRQREAALERKADGGSGEKKETGKNWKKNQRPARLKFSYREQREYETIEGEIAELEARAAKLESEMMENATDPAKLSALAEEKEEAERRLEERMDRWLYLNELAEKIAEQ